ncbi:nadh dehydrogenase : NADH-quinone oxidoreductase subunit D OS=Planctomyces limnophilus (strain ATCC 43296 / DSM 3776 / IFAM 1008 / 290) GN=nuoD PE=3 SV=1: Complex1_49kDa [Gemmataceae bacterium]|nr:nadh dehydrogenase : NADH-quinone oxidoreductase subunit D OS=Planctomyces limnophilus (strain ATCC 43296 / DSM 3776 / IFAM 1008 / 290) GN=nuoD PE=3 SV=1: Complex1_49kDa [Gemmataceae bacterium]VTT97224.1 nadh dehydrogenase : NADH-quinone oxidoreductase subunit D OS=Planctomyces limnophilus (strain ATCC 43296 / DSM 3776 / IFAM 1008 / 290) GN=nuoD PE=3 SV=1: Complex1_49kDa [Gemmataceae bacterium]
MPLETATPVEDVAGADREFLYTLNFGPQHPATHTTLRLILTLEGETIVKAVPDIGYLHSGFEKLGEDLDFNQYVTIVDRMNYISPFANECAWFTAVEKLLNIDVTPRCKYLRVILAELARISDHLLCVGAAALDLGALTAFLYAFNQREKVYDIMEFASGQRFHPSFCRVGGLMADVSDDVVAKVRDFVKTFPKAHADLVRLLNRNRIFVDRTKGIGVISKEDAINTGCSGPVARAAGVVRDLRKDEPYLAYKELAGSFKVVCGKGGDCYNRYLVRMGEMAESLNIIAAAVENIPGGPVNVNLEDKLTIPDKNATYRSIEGLIQHFELFMWNRRWETPVEEVYGANETANGELGYYLVADGGGRPFRARTRPPSFIHFAVFPQMIEGHQISDVPAVLGSLNIIAAELDR